MRHRHCSMVPVASVASTLFCCVLLSSCDRSEDQPASDSSALSESGERQFERAHQFLGSGQTDEAIHIATELTTSASGDWRSHELLARSYMQRALALKKEGLIEPFSAALGKAVDGYGRALPLSGEIGGLYRSAADAAQMHGQTELAISWYEQSIEIDPDDPRSPLRLAQVIFESHPAEARALLNRVVQLNTSIPEAYASLSLLDATQGNIASARSHMKHAVEMATDVAAIRIVQARMHRMLGEPQRGAEILFALPPADRAMESTATELARCWGAIGQHARAADAWAACYQSLAHRSDAWRFAIEAAKSSLRAGDQPRAASFLNQAVYLSAPPAEVEAARRTQSS
jgi:tetratricopeptide (TPR) repeat protein